MHVEDVLAREADTALAKALKAEPNFDRFLLDDEGWYEGPINAYSSHWVEINIHEIDNQAIDWLKFGNCVALAWELHVLTGHPLAIVMLNAEERLQNWAHVALKLPSGDYLDIEGTHSEDQLLRDWSNATELRHIDPTNHADMKFLTETCAEDDKDFVTSLDEHYDAVERELIRDFARILVAKNIH